MSRLYSDLRRPATTTTHIDFNEGKTETAFLRELERNFKFMEEAFGISISSRGDRLLIQGVGASVERALAVVGELKGLWLEGRRLSAEDMRQVLSTAASGSDLPLRELLGHNVAVSSKKRLIFPKSAHQLEYIEAIRSHDIVFGIGPAGTGKTYLAMAMAVNALLKNLVSRVVLARPAVEAGEKLGFLPGDIAEKVNPYLRPLYDALYDMVELEKAGRLIEKGVIEIAPLAFMRGRTLNDSFVILDEAQNTTGEQMKMFLTRLGFGSKAVITGDVTQIDLPQGRASGLVEARDVLGSIDGIKIVYFSGKDVVRHRLVQKVVEAYGDYKRD